MKFYNTKTRQVDEFKAIEPNKVSLYTCGPTVYNYLHVGNWVAYIRWDILVRTLRASDYDVSRVMNITDVGHLVSDADDGEDKMEKGAKREGKTAWEVAKIYTDDFLDGMHKLNVIEPTFITKATDYIPEQIALVQTLSDKGFTYVIDDGVYFDTSKFPSYAEFAHLDLADQEAGARVEFNPQKRNGSDFALWKFSPVGEKRDMEWDSPWGKGFPGWHLECSAMAMDKLGETIDIHTGGIDHIPVHHTNEIAQSEAATGKPFSNFWIHNNFLMVDGTKVSKSLGNTYTLQDLAKEGFTPEDFRMFVLQSHYRTESNFTWENLQGAKNRLHGYYAMSDLKHQPNAATAIVQEMNDQTYDGMLEGILRELQDDLDTPSALTFLSHYSDHILNNGYNVDYFQKFLEGVDSLLGLSLSNRPDITDEQKELMAQRAQARTDKDWVKSDELRDELRNQGIEVRDANAGQIWSRI